MDELHLDFFIIEVLVKPDLLRIARRFLFLFRLLLLCRLLISDLLLVQKILAKLQASERNRVAKVVVYVYWETFRGWFAEILSFEHGRYSFEIKVGGAFLINLNLLKLGLKRSLNAPYFRAHPPLQHTLTRV